MGVDPFRSQRCRLGQFRLLDTGSLCARLHPPEGRGMRPMQQHNSDYYREQAEKYRELAEKSPDPAVTREYLELAAACEEAADRMDDMRSSG